MEHSPAAFWTVGQRTRLGWLYSMHDHYRSNHGLSRHRCPEAWLHVVLADDGAIVREGHVANAILMYTGEPAEAAATRPRRSSRSKFSVTSLRPTANANSRPVRCPPVVYEPSIAQAPVPRVRAVCVVQGSVAGDSDGHGGCVLQFTDVFVLWCAWESARSPIPLHERRV